MLKFKRKFRSLKVKVWIKIIKTVKMDPKQEKHQWPNVSGWCLFVVCAKEKPRQTSLLLLLLLLSSSSSLTLYFILYYDYFNICWLSLTNHSHNQLHTIVWQYSHECLIIETILLTELPQFQLVQIIDATLQNCGEAEQYFDKQSVCCLLCSGLCCFVLR